jgi:hypothetical protein
MRVHFRGDVFTEPLSSNELFRLSGVMSQYVYSITVSWYEEDEWDRFSFSLIRVLAP